MKKSLKAFVRWVLSLAQNKAKWWGDICKLPGVIVISTIKIARHEETSPFVRRFTNKFRSTFGWCKVCNSILYAVCFCKHLFLSPWNGMLLSFIFLKPCILHIHLYYMMIQTARTHLGFVRKTCFRHRSEGDSSLLLFPCINSLVITGPRYILLQYCGFISTNVSKQSIPHINWNVMYRH